jgi:hypothetical protein
MMGKLGQMMGMGGMPSPEQIAAMQQKLGAGGAPGLPDAPPPGLTLPPTFPGLGGGLPKLPPGLGGGFNPFSGKKK